ncbi:tetratricopeptide repeat protein [Roseofilum reptotaenium CS-1145]|uniref:protein O-GlcNAc transferase n=1 Tax=Roseofilum reptotaenium AO1-A TaxID=1925591 RepID=A0A1L9QV88_9CYAN|nr:tetratricopeptide repeat protein [Roseofilum reptotaenium]MDB9518816.1 tetratricopeptide repeat protein [Roseofilum reptotaenium CS-1145]OJJ26601.1 O-linked N-acetylglucosamine transferase, SPINDLY family protein [Roseofilum reptotaenium AO1-A]
MTGISTTELQQQALEYFVTQDYAQAVTLYQNWLDMYPECREGYWYLGLALLLQGQEIEAQVTWMLVIGEATDEEIGLWTQELVSVLETEAERQVKANQPKLTWVIRQHIREIDPTDINNLLNLLQLALELERLTEDELTEIGITDLLSANSEAVEVNLPLLLETLNVFLDKAPLDPLLPKFVEVCVPFISIEDLSAFLKIILSSCIKISRTLFHPEVSITLAKIALKADPEHPEIWRQLSNYYQLNREYEKALEAAEIVHQLAQNSIDKIIANFLKITALMDTGGRWHDALVISDQQAELLLSLDPKEAQNYPLFSSSRLYTSSYFFPYFRDEARANREIHNHLAQFCQSGIEFHEQERVQRYRKGWNAPGSKSKRLRIGYLSHCFMSHSVGWLARWLFQHHDQEQYEIYAYVVNYKSESPDPLQQWYVENVTQARKLGREDLEVADRISEDNIDILVDLDSLTLDLACTVMALKPAPIQVSWLGWDAPGIPTIDYMIADPYVLPENAQDYYCETIWRLPQTYIAVDGFEVEVPTLRREMLDIPNDAVLYFSSQRGFKRHPDNARAQLKIIKEVPNSYFLIKGLGDQDLIKQFFLQLAEEEGVLEEQLRFIRPAPSEAMHRANMSILDVVLDTFPYNGATTTLETLWMGVPIVTQVGKQFAARNSYTMMMNVGVTEGIAWTDEEYIKWGIRFGKEPELRQNVAWKLKESRKTSPLWNSKQFAREMEKAYEQMWQRYVESGD